MPAVILSFDVLPLSLLGCYGSTTVETPNLDYLASRSVLFDQHFGTDFSDPGGSPWLTHLGRDALAGQLLGDPALQVNLLTDCPVLPLPELPCPVTVLPFAEQPEPGAGHIPFAQLVQKGCEAIREMASEDQPGQLLWLHSSGLTPDFLPPDDFADLESSLVLSLPAEQWPDGMLQASGFVAWADLWLGELLQTVEDVCHQQELLFVLTAARSGRGPLPHLPREERIQQTGLTEEIVHTPLLVWSPGLPPGRRQELIQSTDLLPTLAEWFTPGVPAPADSLWPLLRNVGDDGRKTVRFENDGFQGIRTAREYLIVPRSTSPADPLELLDNGVYILKPQDVWDTHNRITEFPREAEELLSLK